MLVFTPNLAAEALETCKLLAPRLPAVRALLPKFGLILLPAMAAVVAMWLSLMLPAAIWVALMVALAN